MRSTNRLINTLRENWLKRSSSSSSLILKNAGALTGTVIISAGLGFVYWWLAARLFAVQAVGYASATISIMTLLANLSLLGLGTLLIGEIRRKPDKAGSLIAAAALAVGVTGGILAGGFALCAPHFLYEFAALGENLINIALFTSGVVFTSVSLIIDQASLGLLRGELQLSRNTLFASSKLFLLFLVGNYLQEKSGFSIYITWVAGNFISIVLLLVLLHRANIKINFNRPDWQLLKGLRSSAVLHHIVNIAGLAPGLLLPTVVTAFFSSKITATFYVAWLIASFLFATTSSLTTALYAVGAADPTSLAHKVRFTLKLSLALVALGNVILLAGVNLILNMFGPSYAQEATWCLRLLGLGAFAVIIKVHFLAISQVSNNMTQAARLMILGGILELGFAIAGGALGTLAWLSAGWLIGISVEALLMTPEVYRIIKPKEGSKGRESVGKKYLQNELRLIVNVNRNKPAAPLIPVPEFIELKFSSEDAVLKVGRHSKNNIVLPFLTVSRFHVELRKVPQGLLLRDLASKNKTLINNELVVPGKDYLIQPGDLCRLGDVTLSLVAAGPVEIEGRNKSVTAIK